jgi:hypothetical protein
MRRLGKIALGGVMLAATAAIASPASAQIHFGIGVGPGYYSPPPRAVCDPYSRWYNPYSCRDYYGYRYRPEFGFGGYWGDRRYSHFHRR